MKLGSALYDFYLFITFKIFYKLADSQYLQNLLEACIIIIVCVIKQLAE